MLPVNYTPESIFCLVSSFLCLLTGVILLMYSKYGNRANIYLGSSYLSLALGFAVIFMIFSHLIFYAPHLYRTGNLFLLLYMPLSYLHVRTIATQRRLTVLDLFHLLPILLYVVDYSPFFFLPASSKIEIMHAELSNIDLLLEYRQSWLFPNNFHIPLRTLQMAFYWLLQVRMLASLESAIVKQNKLWVRWQIIYNLLQLLIFFPALAVFASGKDTYMWAISIPPAAGGLLSAITLYLYPQVLYNLKPANEKNKIPKNKMPFSESRLEIIATQLTYHMQINKPFLNPNYSLKEMADELDMMPHHLSAYINQIEGKNFSDYLNQWRIQHCIEIIKSGLSANLNLYGLALQCGFNNRNTFSSAFKKVTGETPAAYMRINSNQ